VATLIKINIFGTIGKKFEFSFTWASIIDLYFQVPKVTVIGNIPGIFCHQCGVYTVHHKTYVTVCY